MVNPSKAVRKANYRKDRKRLISELYRFETFVESLLQLDKPNFIKSTELSHRYEDMTKCRDEFKLVQRELDYLSDDDSDDENEVVEEFDNKYYSIRAKCDSLLLNPDIQRLESNAGSAICGQNQNVKLPVINLPSFYGSYEKWLEFHDVFDSLIHKNNYISDVQKFHYLKSSLKGEAANVICALEISAQNYSIGWKLVRERYENKRLLINNHVKALFDITKIQTESSFLIRKLVDNVTTHLRALETLKQPVNSWDTLLIHIITRKLDSLSIREWQNFKISGEFPTFEELRVFLKQKADVLETLEGNNVGNKVDRIKNKPTVKSLITITSPCAFCNNTSHLIYNCPEFLALNQSDRLDKVKQNRLCINCLRAGHFVGACRGRVCSKCKAKHNVLLHIDRQQTSMVQEVEQRQVILANSVCQTVGQVLLSTAVVNIVDEFKNVHPFRVLLDSGSQSNFISADACRRLNLQCSPTNIEIVGVGRVKSNLNLKCNIQLESRVNKYKAFATCFVLENICGQLPNQSIKISTMHIPKHLKLADPDFNKPSTIDLLLGASFFWKIIKRGIFKLGNSNPVLQNTELGYIISGNVPQSNEQVHCNLMHLNDQLAKFWALEECEVTPPLSAEEVACEKHFVSNFSRDSDGRFVVQLPFKESVTKLGDSKQRALKQFYSLERKLSVDVVLKERYINFMNEYLALGHMHKVEGDDAISYFLPHHGVLKESSETTKLRVVFNGSASTTTGISLNDLQMIGPTIQRDLFSILIQFRQFAFVVSADIAMMYRQVSIAPQQRSLQKIVWRADPSLPLEEYKLTTVTYGMTAAPFLAIRSLSQLAVENAEKYPEAARIITDNFYVDDLLVGSDDRDELIRHCRSVSDILKDGCFELRKWISNDPCVLKGVTVSSGLETKHTFGESGETKTLGIFWTSKLDKLSYEINADVPLKITKRSILSTIAKIFDPLGLLALSTIVAKIMLQRLWIEKLSWDDQVPNAIRHSWLDFINNLSKLNNLKVPRHAICIKPVDVEIHTFCDASMDAYGACVYLRSTNTNGITSSKLLCAKSKVAPLKPLSIPRLELCAAVLATRLTKKVVAALQCQGLLKCTFWSDSTIVLGWIHTQPNLLKTFVCHRVVEIQEHTSRYLWRHVPSKDNPADLLSRGVSPNLVAGCDLWWNGPNWLLCEPSRWPSKKPLIDVLPEMRHIKTALAVTAVESFINFENYSTLRRLVAAIAFCIRFKNNCRSHTNDRKYGRLSKSELNHAEICIVKHVQMHAFVDDYKNLNKNKAIAKSSNLINLNPFIDELGLIRVGGRIGQSQFCFDKKYPLVLPPKHVFTLLLLRQEHKRLLHVGPQQLLASVRERYWPIFGRNVARKVVRECVICFKANPKVFYPLMGNLPENRLQITYPFAITGVDYAGPFLIKDKRTRGWKSIKSYICLFVCFTTKAIHLELASDLSKDAFIAAFRRFIARRGKPVEMISDNGTNFIGAKNELTELYTFLKNNEQDFTDHKITWKFIPPRSPHMGGLHEAGVKSVKFHLKRVASKAMLCYDEFYTLLVQIEAVLNSRPLCPLSSDPTDLDHLTPSHFLIGRATTSIIDPCLGGIKENRLSNYQRIQQLKQHFWSRWSKEYISELQQRTKWKIQQGSISVDTLVVIKEDNTPPACWRLGRVLAVHPGTDGIVRVVTVKTSSGIMKRPVVKICPLPSEDTTLSKCSVVNN